MGCGGLLEALSMIMEKSSTGGRKEPVNYRSVQSAWHWCQTKCLNSTFSRNELIKNKSCQTKPISFFDKVIDLLDHRNMMDKVYFEFSKVSHEIPGKKDMTKCGLDCTTGRWIPSWLNHPNWITIVLCQDGGKCWMTYYKIS